jgi:riboflavin kinase/FMN adenylyltransferase
VTLLWRELPAPGEIPGDVALTIGAFDGVHRGHMMLLRRLTEIAADAGAAPVVLTFEPHPRCVVDPAGCPPLLTSFEERVLRFGVAGVKVVALPFTWELSLQIASDFLGAVTSSLRLEHVVVGPRFAVGRDRQGDVAFLTAYGRERGFEVTVVPEMMLGGSAVSSTRIRAAIQEGRVVKAKRLLGRWYSVDGRVVRGEGRGMTLGFPTANLAVDPSRCLPAPGVYATWLHVDDSWHAAATSVGFNPTFGGTSLTVEAHVLDFAGDLYDRAVQLAFVSRQRGERVFPDSDALVAEIERDVAETRRLLAMATPPAPPEAQP